MIWKVEFARGNLEEKIIWKTVSGGFKGLARKYV
jgi:hypothetical protein